jgi:hypothetical protein
MGSADEVPRLPPMRAVDRLLRHPIVERIGAIQALLGAGLFAWGVLHDVSPLVAVGAVLLAVNLVLLLGPRVRKRLKPRKKKLAPGERQQTIDDLIYPPADPRRELGERCETFAKVVQSLIAEYKEARPVDTGKAMREALEADPGLGQEQAHRSARAFVDRNFEATYALMYRDDGLKLFDEAREEGAIAAKLRRTVEHPLAVAMGEVPNIFRVIARRLGVSVPEPDSLPEKPLADRLDDILRDGMDLREDLSARVEPEERKPGVWAVVDGVPDGWWEKVDAFDQRIRDLLRAGHPALLSTYAEGHNNYVHSQRGDDEPKVKDGRGSPLTVLEFFNTTREAPMRHMDAILEGLAAARRQLGTEVLGSSLSL